MCSGEWGAGVEFTATYDMDREEKAFFVKAQLPCEHESRIIVVLLMDTLASIDLMSPS